MLFSSIKISIIYEFNGQGTSVFSRFSGISTLLHPHPHFSGCFLLSQHRIEKQADSGHPWAGPTFHGHWSCYFFFTTPSMNLTNVVLFPIVVCTIPDLLFVFHILWVCFGHGILELSSTRNKRPYFSVCCIRKFHIGPISNEGLQC